jgi:Aromatic-ring-opening dioxygenase LigAB, LigA subunit
MSIYAVNKLCQQSLHDLALREALKRDPAAAIASWPLTDDERTALLAGDVAWLYEQGAHPFLLAYLTRWELFGLTVPLYSERIRKVREPAATD